MTFVYKSRIFMYMIRLKNILLERVDFHQLATKIVKDVGLKSTVKFIDTGKNKADYTVETDTINIKPTNNLKDFLVTVYHEIDHALDASATEAQSFNSFRTPNNPVTATTNSFLYVPLFLDAAGLLHEQAALT